MEAVIIEALPLVGPPGAMALVILYYFMRQAKVAPKADSLDDVRAQLARVAMIAEENRTTIRQVRDWVLILKDREERG